MPDSTVLNAQVSESNANQSCESSNYSTLASISDALESLGYEAKLHTSSIGINVGHNIIASMMIDGNDLLVCCHLTTLGRIVPNDAASAAPILLDLLRHNAAIRPFAITALADGEHDDNPEDDPIVLEDSVPLGDFCKDELKKLMESLNKAVASTSKLIKEIVATTAG